MGIVSNTGLWAEGVTQGYGQSKLHRAMGRVSNTGLWAERVIHGYGQRERHKS